MFDLQGWKLHQIGYRLPFKKCPKCEEYQLYKSYDSKWVGWKIWCYVCGWKLI